MKLNLGCGRRKLDGYINCDLPDNSYGVTPDVSCNICQLPFGDGSAEEILAVHVFEHVWLKDIRSVLAEWKRVLTPDGLLIMEMPCLNKILHWFDQPDMDPRMTMFALYGDPGTHKSEADLHKWCWSKEAIKAALENAGFSNVRIEQAQYHVPSRDMRVVSSNVDKRRIE